MANYKVTIKYSKVKKDGEVEQREYQEYHSCDDSKDAIRYTLKDLHTKDAECVVENVQVEEVNG